MEKLMYTLIESLTLLHAGTQCHIVHQWLHQAAMPQFLPSQTLLNELCLFVVWNNIMADDRQRCYAFPEQQEIKTVN